MRSEHLRAALSEYRPSLVVLVTDQSRVIVRTTVIELLCDLSKVPDGPLTYFGRTDPIIKERIRDFSGKWRPEAQMDLLAEPSPSDVWIEIELCHGS